MAFEERREYVAASSFRFAEDNTVLQELFEQISSGEEVAISLRQQRLVL